MNSAREHGKIHVDVLVRAGADDAASVQDIEQHRPSPAQVETVRQRLAARGLLLHATAFGVSGTVERHVLARALQLPSETLAPGATLKVPDEFANLVEQITIAPAPELF